MPSVLFAEAALAALARMAQSGIISIRPAPKVGVGMRKTTFFAASCAAKSGCLSEHPSAPSRPVIVNNAWTPPSGLPSLLRTNRASRTGPFSDRNDGTLSLPALANATCGFSNGLEPPLAGCE